MQNHFSTKSIFLNGCNSKTNLCKYLKFSPNVYVSVIYLQLNFQNFLVIQKFFIDTLKKISQKNRKFQWFINNSKKVKIF